MDEKIREQISEIQREITEITSWLGSELGYKTQANGNRNRIFETRFKLIEKITDDIAGSGDRMGIRTKVQIIWRTYVWFLCAISGTVGSVLTWIVIKKLDQ